VLSDNGRQYYTWRGKSQFTTMLTKLGIRHIRSRPYHPQTLGKIESFWRNLFQECLSQLPLSSFEEAQEKIGTYVEYYNFKRPHQGIDNVTPSDRFYKVAGQVKQIIEENTARMEQAPAPLAADYAPPAYLVGNLGGKELRVIAQGAQVSLKEIDHDGQTSESQGAVAVDTSGNNAATADPGAVPAGGGVAGAVLPVDEASRANGAERAGSQSAGPENGGGEPRSTDQEAGRADQTVREADAAAAQGTGSPEAVGPGGAADHPSAGVGPDAPDGQ
jgi:hypothetical protein